jgi:hypothetical protein
MIGKAAEEQTKPYTYKVERDHGTTDFVRIYEVGVFPIVGGRLNIIVESNVVGGPKTNVGTIVIPLPDTAEGREALIDTLSTFIREA